MNEFYIELQDADGTAYLHTDITGQVPYYDELDDAKFAAKSALTDRYVVTRVIDTKDKSVVDFFERYIASSEEKKDVR